MLHLRILVLQDGPWWVAQCLEYDLGAEAKSLDDALYEMEKTIVGQIFFDIKHDRVPFSTLPPAPARYVELFHMPQGAPSYESDVRVACA